MKRQYNERNLRIRGGKGRKDHESNPQFPHLNGNLLHTGLSCLPSSRDESKPHLGGSAFLLPTTRN